MFWSFTVWINCSMHWPQNFGLQPHNFLKISQKWAWVSRVFTSFHKFSQVFTSFQHFDNFWMNNCFRQWWLPSNQNQVPPVSRCLEYPGSRIGGFCLQFPNAGKGPFWQWSAKAELLLLKLNQKIFISKNFGNWRT